jgi:hypothetical protein
MPSAWPGKTPKALPPKPRKPRFPAQRIFAFESGQDSSRQIHLFIKKTFRVAGAKHQDIYLIACLPTREYDATFGYYMERCGEPLVQDVSPILFTLVASCTRIFFRMCAYTLVLRGYLCCCLTYKLNKIVRIVHTQATFSQYNSRATASSRATDYSGSASIVRNHSP